MESAFKTWVKRDHYGEGYSVGDHDPFRAESMKDLISGLMMHGSNGNLWRDNKKASTSMDMRLSELIGLEVGLKARGAKIPVEYIIVKALCISHLHGLLEKASRLKGYRSSAEADKEWAAMVKAAGCKTWDELSNRLDDHQNAITLSVALFKIIEKERGSSNLWQFYKLPEKPNGYVSWYSRAWTEIGIPLKTSVTKTSRGNVFMMVARYEEGDESGIRAYEWCAQMKENESDSIPIAAANGMVYVLPRIDGELLCSMSDLRWAADAVADTDVAQVVGFQTQHTDSYERMEAGDLVFLWLWERKNDSQKGDGEVLLKAALSDLKKRFRSIRTLIADILPPQFRVKLSDTDPPEVQEAIHEARESLERHFVRIRAEECLKGELRLIGANTLSPDETLATLGMLDLDGM